MKASLTLTVIGLLSFWLARSVQAEQARFDQLNSKAVQLYGEGKYDEAVTAGEEALKLAEETLPPGDKDLIVVLENLAASYVGAKKPDQAKATYERILTLKDQDPATSPASKARTLYSLGIVAIDQTNWPAAEDCFKRCLEIHEKASGPDHNDTITTVRSLAWAYQNQKKYTEELPLLERARIAWEKTKGPDSPEVGTADYNLGVISGKLKRKDDMERYYKAALAIRQKHPGEKDADLINTLVDLSNLYRLDENYKAAEPLYKQLLPLQEKNLGKENPALLPTLRGYLEVVGWTEDEKHVFHGLNKKNTADALTKRIHRLEELDPKKDESSKAKRPAK